VTVDDFDYTAVIPAYNAAATLREAVDSIMAQTIPPRVVIVVDDGSTDDTAQVADAIAAPITLIRQANLGPGAATSAGLRAATTPFVATLDADDLWLPRKTAVQAALLLADPGLAGVFALGRTFAGGESASADGPGPVRPLWTRTTLLFRTEAVRQVGDLADFPGRLGDLVDWLARGRELGHRHTMVEEVLALRRIRPGSLSYTIDADRARGYLFAVHAALARRRAANDEAAS